MQQSKAAKPCFALACAQTRSGMAWLSTDVL
jgi:hypothetical protein